MQPFELSFLARAHVRGGLTLFQAPDALAFIEAARAQGVPILGVETFFLEADTIRPQMDHILDLSGADARCDTWGETHGFISERSALGYWFEVTL